jgi:hypothetical protein
LLGHIGSSALAVAVRADVAYVGFRHELVVLDIHEPAQPRWITALPVSANEIRLTEHYAYVVGQGGLSVVDIQTDPRHPTVVGQWASTETVGSVAVAGDYVYLVNREGFYVINIAIPAQPTTSAFVRLPGLWGTILVRGGYAYVAALDGLYLFDLSQPMQPTQVGLLATAQSVHGLATIGHYLYIGVASQLWVVDVTTPAQPTVSERFQASAGIIGIAADGPYLYLACGTGGLHILDGSDPLNLVEIHHEPTIGRAYAVTPDQGYLYLADVDEGVMIYDTTALPTVTVVGTLTTLGAVDQITVTDDYAYVVGGGNRHLHLVALAEPAPPHEIATHLTTTYVEDFALAGNYLYLVSAYGLHVLEVTQPTAPQGLGWLSLPGIFEIYSAGRYLFASDPAGNFWVIDLTEPTKLEVAAHYPAFAFATGMTVAGTLAYLPTTDGVRIVTIAESGQLTQVGFIPLPRIVNRLAVVGHYAYLITDARDFQIIDVADPTAPRLVGRYQTTKVATDLVVDGAYAYITVGAAGLQVLAIADPTQIRAVGYRQTADVALRVAVVDGRIYVADRFGGLWILAFTAPL